MKVVVTCGPSYEPIDGARRITNFSTGRLGITLSNALAHAGHEVYCFKGEGATCPDPLRVHVADSFTTNADLASKLEAVSRQENIGAVFHAAALCDFTVERVVNENGSSISSAKFSTREGKLTLELIPAIKVLPRLREWLPGARLAGWKYELAGGPDDAFAAAWKQLRDCGTDICVLNGAAYGPGFAVCHRGGQVDRWPDVKALIDALRNWLAS